MSVKYSLKLNLNLCWILLLAILILPSTTFVQEDRQGKELRETTYRLDEPPRQRRGETIEIKQPNDRGSIEYMARKYALPADTIQAIEALLGIVPSTGRSDDGTFSMTVSPLQQSASTDGGSCKIRTHQKIGKGARIGV